MAQAITHLWDVWFYLPLLLIIPSKQREGEQKGVPFLSLLSIRLLYYPSAGVNTQLLSRLESAGQNPSGNIHQRACDAE